MNAFPPISPLTISCLVHVTQPKPSSPSNTSGSVKECRHAAREHSEGTSGTRRASALLLLLVPSAGTGEVVGAGAAEFSSETSCFPKSGIKKRENKRWRTVQ